MQPQIELKLKSTAVNYEAHFERERERAERLMAALLRAKGDAATARATIARLEGELAALRSRPWSNWLTWWKEQRTVDSVLSRYTTSLGLILLVVATTAVLTAMVNASHNKKTISAAVAAQNMRAPVDTGDHEFTEAPNVSRNKTTITAGTAAQEMRAPVDGTALNVSLNEMTTSSPRVGITDAEAAPQRVDLPSAIAATPSPAKTPAGVQRASNKPAAEKLVAKRAAVAVRQHAAARQHSTATRERGSVSTDVRAYTGYATAF
jgi:hypothetical protein